MSAPAAGQARLRPMGLATLALVSTAGWTGLWLLQSGAAGADLAGLCLAPVAPGWEAYGPLAAMWAMMAAAMMLPSAAPALDLYLRLSRRLGEARFVHVAAFTGGYLIIWAMFGAAVAALQVAAASWIASLPANALAGGLLMLAGGYQLSALKAACLKACRSPLAFFMGQWRDGLRGAARLGAAHGLTCLGCCWALMGLMLIAGAMNILWMAALGVLMALEKLMPGAERVGRALGPAMILAGLALVIGL